MLTLSAFPIALLLQSEEIAALGILVILFAVIGLLAGAVAVIPFWKYYQRAGHSPWLSLLQLIPLVNIVMQFVLAFGEWPVERELERLRWERQQLRQNPPQE